MRASDGTLRLGTPSPTLLRLEGRQTAAWRPRKIQRTSWFPDPAPAAADYLRALPRDPHPLRRAAQRSLLGRHHLRGRAKPKRRAAVGGEKSAAAERCQDRSKMRDGAGPFGAFEPILIEKRRKGRVAELGFPQDAEQRCHRFLALDGEAEETGGRSRGRAVAGLRARPETEIDAAAPFRRGELEMRELVRQHIGFRVAAQRGAVPTEVELRSSGTDRNAEPPGKCERVGVMRRRPRAGRTLG